MKKTLKADLYLPRIDVDEMHPADLSQALQPEEHQRYTVERLPGGCVVIGLSGGQAAWRAAHKDETSRRGKPTP